MKAKNGFLILGILFAITACVTTTQEPSSEDKQSIKKIYVSEDVHKAGDMYYWGPIGSAAYFLGGTLAAIETSKGPGAALAEYAKQNDIFIEKIVYDTFVMN